MRSEVPSGRSDSGPTRPATITLGHVSRPNGLRGAVVLQIDPSIADMVVPGLAVELRPRDAAPFRTRVRSAAPIRGGLRVTFDDVGDRDTAEALVGATATIERDALGPLGEGEYLDVDLLGLAVVDEDGSPLGRLVEVIPTAANDVYVARRDDGAEVLIPAVAHAVLRVDTAAGRMTVAADALEYGAEPAPGKNR